MTDFPYESAHNRQVKYLLNEIGFILIPSYSHNKTPKAEVYVHGENMADDSTLVRVGEFAVPYSGVEFAHGSLCIWPKVYEGGGEENKWHDAWSSIVESIWAHVSIFYSPHKKDFKKEMKEELRDMLSTMIEYSEQIIYPAYLGFNEKVQSEEDRLAKNRVALPYLLAGDTVDVTNTFLRHGVMANSPVAACFRAEFITLDRVEEYQTYPRQWLNQLYPQSEIKSVPELAKISIE